MSVIHGSAKEFNELINHELVLVDFYADWCGPCKMLAPILDSIGNTRNSLKIVKMNVDENEELSSSLGIMSIPTLIIYRNGAAVSKRVGFVPETELNKWIDENK